MSYVDELCHRKRTIRQSAASRRNSVRGTSRIWKLLPLLLLLFESSEVGQADCITNL